MLNGGLRLYHENLYFDTRRWRQIAGHTVNWEKDGGVLDLWKGDQNGFLYVFDHNPIPQSEIRFVTLSGREFDVEWTGKAHVYWGKDYWENLLFSVRTPVVFQHVEVSGTWRTPTPQCSNTCRSSSIRLISCNIQSRSGSHVVSLSRNY